MIRGKNLYWGSLLVIMTFCVLIGTLLAKTGSYTFIWTGTAPTGTMIRITAKAENGVTYDDSFAVAGMTANQTAALCSTALHDAGWSVTLNGGNSITITGRILGSPIKEVDIGDNRVWTDTQADGNCTIAEALPGDKNWKFAMAWPPADPTGPGVLALALNTYHIQVPLPPGATPTMAAQMLMQGLIQAGFIVSLQGDTVQLDWEIPSNQGMLGPAVYTTLVNTNGGGGPHLMIGLPNTVPPPNLDVTVTPVNPPIVVPSQGGQFSLNAAVVNHGPTPGPFTVWARMKFPLGGYTAPTLGPVSINPPFNTTVQRLRNQSIPNTYPPGSYQYLLYANWNFSYPAVDSSFFSFTKSVVADKGPTVWDAVGSGEPFPGEEWLVSTPSAFSLVEAHPNPFNPTTVIRYQMPDARYVNLRVYDTTGRLVATLVDGWREAGIHETNFDGSNLASGVYLYTLTAGQEHVSGKMVLLK